MISTSTAALQQHILLGAKHIRLH